MTVWAAAVGALEGDLHTIAGTQLVNEGRQLAHRGCRVTVEGNDDVPPLETGLVGGGSRLDVLQARAGR